RRLHLEAGELDAVVGVSLDAALRQGLKSRRLIGELDELHRRNALAENARVGRALLCGDALSRDGFDALDRAAFFHQKLRAGIKERDAEIDALAALFRIRHRFGYEVDGVRGEQRDARGRRGFLLFELDRLAELLRQPGRDELLDEIDRKTHPAVVFIDVCERRRAGARADRERASAADLFERSLRRSGTKAK